MNNNRGTGSGFYGHTLEMIINDAEKRNVVRLKQKDTSCASLVSRVFIVCLFLFSHCQALFGYFLHIRVGITDFHAQLNIQIRRHSQRVFANLKYKK
jgi:hypothetical protein